MEITIEELIAFCEEEEYNHRLKCKRYDDASGYTRSKNKNIRTACAIREATYADFYKEISDTMCKYQKIKQLVNQAEYAGENNYTGEAEWILTDSVYQKIREILEDGNDG